MKKRIITLLSITLLTANISFAEYAYIDSDDFTGDAFFTPPVLKEKQIEQNNGSSGRQPATPPLKKLRLKIKKKMQMQDAEKLELAPTAPQDSIFNAQTEMSEYVSKDLKDNFDDYSMPDGFEADEEAISEHSKRHFWSKKDRSAKKNLENKDSDNIILDSENINYDTNNYCIVATGNVSVNFVKHDSVIKADKITYDRMNNTIKAEGNVHILKNGQTINGDYIFVDMNEENALIENPLTQTAEITMRAQRGYVYGDKIVQENGVIDVDKSFNINFSSLNSGPNIGKMIPPPKEQITDAGKRISIKAKEIKVTQKGELEIVDLKRVSIFRGNKKILSVPPAKIYTNKNFDFADTSSMELGSFRGLGMYLGYGHVFEIPGGSILKVMPILNYKSGFGIGGIARYNSASNWTQASYGTAASKFMIRGKQKLDDNLSLQYVMNDYMPEWFLGRRRAKYGASLVYKNGYSQDSFLIKGQASSFAHQFDFGYFQDIDEDKSYDRPGGSELGTIRTRYMAQVNQNLFSHRNIENQTEFTFGVVGQLSAALYGTGDSQVIGRVGPILHTQYKRWMQDAGYFQSEYHDGSPMPVFDSYRYGKSNFYLREYLRLNKYITLSWFGSFNLSNDSPNNKSIQENTFYITFGPEDIKFSLGYDVERETTRFLVELMMDAKGTHIEYDKLEIKQDKKAKKKEEVTEESSDFKNTAKPVLQHAVVEDIKVTEDVL